MMDCRSMREMMLEADLSSLRGEDDSALARHVRSCSACRAVAGALVTDTAALSALLISERALLPEARPVAKVRDLPRTRPSRTTRLAAALALPLAAAAVIVLTSRPESRGPGQPEEIPTPPAVVGDTAVEEPLLVQRREASPSRSPAAALVRANPASAVDGTGRPEAAVGLGDEEVAAGPESRPPALSGAGGPAPGAAERGVAAGGVHVSVAAGRSTLMMRTRDPRVTVVWVY